MKVTEAMEKGLEENPDIKFAKLTWFFKEPEGRFACAIGLALIGKFGLDSIKSLETSAAYSAFIKTFEVDPAEIWRVNDNMSFLPNQTSDESKFKAVIERLKEKGF